MAMPAPKTKAMAVPTMMKTPAKKTMAMPVKTTLATSIKVKILGNSWIRLSVFFAWL